MKIILASGSSRRKELLEATGLVFEVRPSPAEEIHDGSFGMARLCEENARIKAMAVAVDFPEAAVIGADTLVFLDGEPLGKPKDMAAAAGMLRKLSGRTHQVCTGVCVAAPGEGIETFHGVTDVVFHELNAAEIAEYLEKTSPLDKAGSYGIQDHGELIVERIVGDFDNVMGLPVRLVIQALEGIGLPKAER